MKKIVSILVCGLTLMGTALGGDQPQWGTAWSRNMVSSERGLPDSFDPKSGKNIRWRANLGTESHSTPIVAGGRVYIGSNNGEPRDPRHNGDRGVLMCFDERDGHLLWQLVVPKREEDPFHDWPKTGISSPVTVEGDRVYLVSNRGEVMCLDAHGMANGNDGPFLDEGNHMTPQPTNGASSSTVVQLTPGPLDADVIWLFDLTSGAGIWSHDAAHSSILIHGDYLYLNTGTGVDNTHKKIRAPDAPSLVVLDKRTGHLVARDGEHMAPNIFHSTWSSPSLAEVNGRARLFFAGGNGVVYAFEPLRNGALERWDNGELAKPTTAGPSSATLHHSNTPSPQFLSSVWQFDFDPGAPKTNVQKFNSNRRESPSNFFGMPVFYQNRIYVAGGGDIWWGKNEAWLKCIDATKAGDITTNGLIWSYALQKHVLGTPAIMHGLVFIADIGHVMHCVDAETGKPYWTEELKGEAWASPLAADGKVYIGTRSGVFYIFKAGKEKELLSTIELGSPISATACAANGVLYVANMNHLYAVQRGSSGMKAAPAPPE